MFIIWTRCHCSVLTHTGSLFLVLFMCFFQCQLAWIHGEPFCALLVLVCSNACMFSCICVCVCACGGCYQPLGWGFGGKVGGGWWGLSIISFNYPEHSERPKLTPLLSSGCWKSHAYFRTRRPIVCHSALLLSSDKTYHCYLSLPLPPSLSPLCSKHVACVQNKRVNNRYLYSSCGLVVKQV